MSQKDQHVTSLDTGKNISRFFVEQHHIAWMLLVMTCVWGIYSYLTMPQRKDPDIPVRVAVAVTPWVGVDAEKVEQLVTRKVESTIAKNTTVEEIKSLSLTGVSIVTCKISDTAKDTKSELKDIALNLSQMHDLPPNAGPVNFIRDFGDTATLLLTVASPQVSEAEVKLRAMAIQQVLANDRQRFTVHADRHPVSIVVGLPMSVSPSVLQDQVAQFIAHAQSTGLASDLRMLCGPGYIAVDGVSKKTDEQIYSAIQAFTHTELQVAEVHPDVWMPVVIRDLAKTEEQLCRVAGEKYSYRQLDDFTDEIERRLKRLPSVSKVTRSGVLGEQITLNYSQARLPAYGVRPIDLPKLLEARNTTLPGGELDAGGKNIAINPSGEFRSERELGDVLIPAASQGLPLHLRDIVDIHREYQVPRYLNYFSTPSSDGKWHRHRAITMAIQMGDGKQIKEFNQVVKAELTDIQRQLPDDLSVAITSDQPKQVDEKISEFMRCLIEAILLVVIVSFIGFKDWRVALLLAVSIPITLFMTFGFMSALRIDLQQVSIATLIIALGLLVDYPVVAGDAIRREMASGLPRGIASWLGPTRLGKALLFATITNVAAYLPLLLLTGDIGKFLYSLPVVIACSLLASLIATRTFIPLLSQYILAPKAEPTLEERRHQKFGKCYVHLLETFIRYRWGVLAVSLIFLVAGIACFTNLKQAFFPKDLSYLSYVDVWLPEDATFSATRAVAWQAEEIIREVAESYHGHHKEHGTTLKSLTTFVGGGSPRFWFSVEPELQRPNYAQIIIEVNDKHDTREIAPLIQEKLSSAIPGARLDVRQLETGPPVGIPVSIEISGNDLNTLHALANDAKEIFRSTPLAARIRDDWGQQTLAVDLATDTDRANLSGITNTDVALSSAAGIYGLPVSTLREDNKQIPVVARLKMAERSQLSDLENLYVYSLIGQQKLPLSQVSEIRYRTQSPVIRRKDQLRSITVSCFPITRSQPSEVLHAVRGKLDAFQQHLPPGYKLKIIGEEKEKTKSFGQLAAVMAISGILIYLALVFQFKSATKPLVVLSSIPFGIAGALLALKLMDTPFGFMAFLGISSLIGVIVSQSVVLFEFIEENHEHGVPLKEALINSCIMRMRPVSIAVLATVTALFPLAHKGGPLWEPMCYAQIGGLLTAMCCTLLMVPVVYTIFVVDLKLIKWDIHEATSQTAVELPEAEAVM